MFLDIGSLLGSAILKICWNSQRLFLSKIFAFDPIEGSDRSTSNYQL